MNIQRVVPDFPSTVARVNPAKNTETKTDTVETSQNQVENSTEQTLTTYESSVHEPSEINFSKNPSNPTALETAKQELQKSIQNFATEDPEKFKQSIQQIYGEKISPKQLEQIYQQASKGDIPLPENIEFVDTEVLNGNTAAYSSENGGTLYIDKDLKDNPVMLQNLLTHEIGHHIDAVLGAKDTTGDEGQMLGMALLKKGPLNEAELKHARETDDSGVIEIDGKSIEVEHVAPLVAAWWAAKVAATTSVDVALDYAIASVMGLPTPGAKAAITNFLANAIPGVGEWNTGRKIAKLGAAVAKVSSAVNKIKRLPGGASALKRIEDVSESMMQAFKSGNLTKAKAEFEKLFSHLRDAQNTAKTMVRGKKSIQVTRSGGMQQAHKEFRQMLREHGVDPSKVKDQGNGIYSAVLPDGSNISIRPRSSKRPGHPDGLPTIQVVPPKGEGKAVKIRYE